MGFRPMDFRKLMSAIIIQRAMKQNLRLSQAKADLNDAMLEQHLPQDEHIRGSGFGKHHAVRLRDSLGRTVFRCHVERLKRADEERAWGLLGGLRGFDWLRIVQWRNLVLHSRTTSVPTSVPTALLERTLSSKSSHETREVGTYGSLYLPPTKRELKWIMRKYLRDLRRRRDLGVNDDEEGLDPDQEQQKERTPGKSAPPRLGHGVELESGGQGTVEKKRNGGAKGTIPSLDEALSISGEGVVEDQGMGNPESSCAEAPGE